MKFLSNTLILFIFVISILASCSKQYINTNPQTLLEERVREFYSDLDAQIIWKLVNEAWRKSYNNDKKEFIEYFEKNKPFKEFKDFHFYIKEIEVDRYKARVTMRFIGEEIKTGKKLDDILYDYWIFENGNWYMNDPGRIQ